MWFLHDPIFWALVGFGVLIGLWNKADDKRRIRALLAANDQYWNQLLIKHQKAIAEAYQEGRPFQIDIERD